MRPVPGPVTLLAALALATLPAAAAGGARAATPAAGGLLPAGPQDRPTAAQAELAAAEAALAAAREEKDAAATELERVVEDLKDDFIALTTGPRATTLRHDLVLAMHDSLPAANARLGAEGAKGRTLMRGTRRQILEEAFAAPVAAAAPEVDPRFKAWVARRTAEALSARDSFAGIGEDEVLAIITPLLPPERNWYEFWNDSFHEGVPEAERWRAAYRAYETAGARLDRARNPERYGARGEVAPPGMVLVPGGTYELGPNAGWERAARRVSIKAFALDRHEVTQREYALFVNAQLAGSRTGLLPRGWTLDEASRQVAPDPAQRDLPVLYVGWEQAAAYAAWAGKRLPTEDEWEAAAGGTAGLAFPWGNAWKPDACQGGEGAEEPMPVESFAHAPAPCGALDMAGNAWEWTATLESGEDVSVLPAGLVNVVIRGGGFNSRREELAVRYRWTAPGHDTFSSPRYDRPIGIRCAKDL